MSWFETHYFLLDTKPTTTASALTNELTFIDEVTPAAVNNEYDATRPISGKGWPIKTVTTHDAADISLTIKRPANEVYSASGTDTFSRFKKWTEEQSGVHKYLIEIIKRKNTDDPTTAGAWEAFMYDVIPTSNGASGHGGDGVQSYEQTLAVSGASGQLTVTCTADGTFSVALPST